MQEYDLCVIGAGPAGYAATMRALDFGKKVVLIERSQIGGAGLYNGALSSKTLWEIARKVNKYNQMAEKYDCERLSLPFSKILEEVNATVDKRKSQLIENLAPFCTKKAGGILTIIYGKASFLDDQHVQIETAEGTASIRADKFVLATGTRPRHLPAIQIDEKIILSSDGISNLNDYPKSLVILGAGVIGCEFATIFALLGTTKVYLIDKSDRILPFEDEDVAQIVEENLLQNGVTIHRNASLLELKSENGQVRYQLAFKDGRIEDFHVEKALVAVGRVPNTEGLGLENTSVQLDQRGYLLEPNKDTCTHCPNINAVGDLTCDIALVNVAELEGRYAVAKMYQSEVPALRYENISMIMFLAPEVAGVGMNEIEARQKGIAYRVAKISFDAIPRAIAMQEKQGFFKILVTNNTEMKLLGMRAVGEEASSAIQAIALLIAAGIGIEKLAEMIHPHPSLSEGVQECLRLLLGNSILKPENCPALSLHSWNP